MSTCGACPTAGGAGGTMFLPLAEPRACAGLVHDMQVLCTLLLFHQDDEKHFAMAAGRALQPPLFPGGFILLICFIEDLPAGPNLELLQ